MSGKLYRSGKHKILGGVAGGIAEYFDVDPVLVRVIFVITLFTFGISLLVYIILWMIIPERPLYVILGLDNEPEEEQFVSSFETLRNKYNKKQKFGIVLLAIGALLLMDNLLSLFSGELFWSFAMIGVGGYFILKK